MRRPHRRLPSTSRRAAPAPSVYPSARTTAPIARWICPQSGIAVRATAAQTNRRRSSASSTAGSRNAIRPSRWPVDWPSRYGASAKTRPPTSAAPRASPSARSHQHVSAPAATIERRTTRLYAQMFPSSARSGQKGIPSSHPCRFGDARRLRPERVRVGPRRAAVLELVPGEPERPAELEVVSGRCLAVARGRPREIAAVDVLHRGPRRPDRAGERRGLGRERRSRRDHGVHVRHLSPEHPRGPDRIALDQERAARGDIRSCPGARTRRRIPWSPRRSSRRAAGRSRPPASSPRRRATRASRARSRRGGCLRLRDRRPCHAGAASRSFTPGDQSKT